MNTNDYDQKLIIAMDTLLDKIIKMAKTSRNGYETERMTDALKNLHELSVRRGVK